MRKYSRRQQFFPLFTEAIICPTTCNNNVHKSRGKKKFIKNKLASVQKAKK